MCGTRRVRGFTLIELLVVVAVIALLIAILIPSLATARSRAYTVKCAANMRALAQADYLYGAEYGVISRDSGAGFPSVFRLLATHQGIQLTVGPSTGKFESEYRDAYSRIHWFQCPSFPKQGQPVSFVTNGFDPSNPSQGIKFLPIRRIFRPGELVNFAEGNVNLPPDNYEVYDIWTDAHIQPNVTTMEIQSGNDTVGRIASDKRHGGKMNLSYYDGHVEAKLIKSIKKIDFVTR